MSKAPCGWCLTGHHDSCKGWSRDRSRRCSCDREGCGGPDIPPPIREAEERPEKPLPGGVTKAIRQHCCLCCGEMTRGGLFKPGHDSKFLSQLVALAVEDRDEALRKAGIVSDPFKAKLIRRLDG